MITSLTIYFPHFGENSIFCFHKNLKNLQKYHSLYVYIATKYQEVVINSK